MRGLLRPSCTLTLVVMVLVSGGCSPAFWGGVARGASGAAPSDGTATEGQSLKLMIFGGDRHATYLGCLNCSQYATDSVFNGYGQSGSRYSSESIWNHYSEYGSRYSTYSACNPYASDPPVIVDGNGNAYGRLTLNGNDTRIGLGVKYLTWLRASVCSD